MLLLNWNSSSSPTKLYPGQTVKTSPKKNAEIMNRYYVTKKSIRKYDRSYLPHPWIPFIPFVV
jgi:hypothetical protein